MSNVRPHMHSYAWSCPSCGNANREDAEKCVVCCCPARYTVAQLESFRAEYVQRGRMVLPPAAPSRQPGDLSAYEILLAPLTLFLLGALPGDLAGSKYEGAWLLILVGPLLFFVSFAVIRWATGGVGFGSSPGPALASFSIAAVGFLFAAGWLAVRAVKSRSLGA